MAVINHTISVGSYSLACRRPPGDSAEHASELSQQGFYPPGLQRRRCQHTDGVQVVNPQYLFLGYYPGAQNCGEQLDVGARATGAFLALVRIGLEIGVSLWVCVWGAAKGQV